MDFIYLLRVLLKRKWIILGAGVVAAAIAYVFTMNEPKKYRSIAQVSTGFTISDDIKVGNENFNFYEADTKFNNAIVTATSPSVLSFLSYTLILHDLQEPKPFRVLSENQKQSDIYKAVKKEDAINVFTDKLSTMSMLTSFKPEEKKLIEYLKLYGYDYKTVGQSLGVYRVQRTDYLQIDYSSENPELSAFVVNSLFQQFLKYYKLVRSSKSMESIDTLRSLMEKKKQELDDKNAALRAAGVSDVAITSASKLELISSLEQTLTAEKSKQTNLYSELKKINQRLENIKTPANNTTPTRSNVDNNELMVLRNAMNQAYADYVNTGSTDQTLLTKYNNLKAQYQAKALTPTTQGQTQVVTPSRTVNLNELLDKKNDLEIDIQSSSITISNLQNQIAGLKGNVQAESSRSVAQDVMLKDAALANKEYIEAKEKYNSATDISTSPVNNFRQILYGQPAIEPEPSKRKLLIGMAGVSAIIVTMLVFVLLTYLDSSVKTPAIFSRVVNLKLISMVNFMNLKNRKLSDILSKKVDGIDLLEKKRHNVFRESLRKLRYEVETSGKKIFLFASTQKGQGKTTLIQALSYSMSLSKKKILIIDTNFSNNDLTVQLNADPILEKIEEKTHKGGTLDEIKKMSTDMGDGYIFAIGSEGGDYTPSEILPRENILQHLRDYTKEFDYIFLEGPPLNDYSDSMELSQYVDGVIAVFSATHVIKQIDKESMKFFKDLNGKFIGSILNKVDLKDVNAS